MQSHMKNPRLRLILAAGVCVFLLGTTLTTGPEESSGCSDHESGTVVCMNPDVLLFPSTIVYYKFSGPVSTSVTVTGFSQKIQLRAGTYACTMIVVSPLKNLPWMDTGSIVVKKNKTITVTYRKPKQIP